MSRHIAWVVFVAVLIGCGGPAPVVDVPDAGTPDAGTPDAGVTCVAGAACTVDSCHQAGQITCSNDTPVCTAAILPDGTSCDIGSCQSGACVAIVTRITLDTNSHLMIADNNSHPTLTTHFYNQSGAEIVGTSVPYDLIVNGQTYSGGKFVTTKADTYELVVRSGDVASNPVTITARENKLYPIIVIPVIFHVVHFGEPVGSYPNLAASQISDLLAALNSRFSKVDPSDPNSVDTRIRFRLATLDPFNAPLPEHGIDRLHGGPWDIGFSGGDPKYDAPFDHLLGPDEITPLEGDTYWDPRQYANVWIIPGKPVQSLTFLPKIRPGSALSGMTTLSADVEPSKDAFDSMFVNTAQAVATIAGEAVSHEMGHKLGLLHPFSIDGCVTDDYCPDTDSWDVYTKQACSGNLGVLVQNNIMGNSDPGVFTYDQRERLQYVLQHGEWLSQLQFSTK